MASRSTRREAEPFLRTAPSRRRDAGGAPTQAGSSAKAGGVGGGGGILGAASGASPGPRRGRGLAPLGGGVPSSEATAAASTSPSREARREGRVVCERFTAPSGADDGGGWGEGVVWGAGRSPTALGPAVPLSACERSGHSKGRERTVRRAKVCKCKRGGRCSRPWDYGVGEVGASAEKSKVKWLNWTRHIK